MVSVTALFTVIGFPRPCGDEPPLDGDEIARALFSPPVRG